MSTKREELIRLVGDVNINWDVYMQVLRYYRWPQLVTAREDRVMKWRRFRVIVEKMLGSINTIIDLCDHLEPGILSEKEFHQLNNIRKKSVERKLGLEYEMERIDRVIELYNAECPEYSDEPEVVAVY